MKIKKINRMVVKIGSSLLIDKDKGVNNNFLNNISEDIVSLKKGGIETLIVSSGAIELGKIELNKTKEKFNLSESQAASSIGQIKLINAWKDSLGKFDLNAAQILITAEDTENRKRFLNARSTIEELMREKYIPIINENDTVATSEIRYGDNDRLAARIAGMVAADCLILLSNVVGLYEKNPSNEESRLVNNVETIDKRITDMAGEAGELGRGGMITKIEAAKIATKSGCQMIISSGRIKNPILSSLNDGIGTVFQSQNKNLSALKSWISGSIKPSGEINIDNGANLALENGKSLLSAGIIDFDGEFDKGDTVTIKSGDKEVARGLTNFNSNDLSKIIGKKSEEIEEILGYLAKTEVIHRNNLFYSGNMDEK